MLRIGVLASHTGTNFQAIADACEEGRLNARLVLLICNNSTAKVMARAERAGIPSRHLSSATHPDPGDLDKAIADALADAGADLVILAGYMKKLGPRVLHDYAGRIINVHPSLLPKYGGAGFYGQRVHQAVIDAGEEVTGVTVHLVSGEYDTGDVLLQQPVPVEPDDTPDSLASRLHPIEHELLIKATQRFAREPAHD